MEFRKLFLFFDLSSLPFKRRVLSGFGLGLLASLLLFSLLSSLNAPSALTSSSSSSSSSFFSWVFSIPDAISGSDSTKILLGQDANSSNSDLGMPHSENATLDTSNNSSNSTALLNVEPVSEKTQDWNSSSSSFSAKESDSGSAHIESSTGESKNSSILVPREQVIENVHLKPSSKDDGMAKAFADKDGAQRQDLGVQGSNTEGKNVSNEINTTESKIEAGKRNDSDSGSMKKTMVEFNDKCNIFNGRWVRDEREPFYPAGSCPYIDIDFDCHKNGRPDDGFLRWRWQSNECDIPRMNATDFLARLRGKRLIFVGDSLNRNMWESLVCILRHSVKRKERVYEASGRHDFKTKGYYSFRFKDYNCSVDFVRSPFLVKELYFKNGTGSDDERLRLDLLDETTSAYREADIVVFNTGHWWTHEKTSSGINYYQEGDHVYPVLKVMEAYKKALTTWANWVDKNINSSKTQVVFRGYSLTHFRGGQWNSGGQCHKETEPIFKETFLAKYPSKMRAFERVMEQMKTPVIYLNISRLTDYRKDGHPSIYRKTYNTVEEHMAAEKSQDCSHWCLPGIPDTWNELLYASLLINGKGPWL